MARIVYRGPNDGVRVMGPGGSQFAFERDVPREVEDDFAASIMSNNPEPWQIESSNAGWFELLPAHKAGKAKGGEG